MNQRKHYNWDKVTGTKLAFPDHVSECGICAGCIKCGICEIGRRAKDGRALFPEPFGIQFGAEKQLPSIRDLQILPEIFGDEIIFQNVKTRTKLGGFKTKLPVVLSSMGSTKVAWENRLELNEGAAKAGIVCGIGESVLSTYGEKTFKQVIEQYIDFQKSNLGGIVVQGNAIEMNADIFEKAVEYGAHGIEIKIGQGAKPGLGGEIVVCSDEEAERYKKMGFIIVPVEKIDENGKMQTCYQRHALPGAMHKKEFKERLFRLNDLEVPIWIKTTYGNDILRLLDFLKELKINDDIRIEAVTVDGHGAGTGMAPWEIMNEFGIPSASILKNMDKMPFDIIVSGGFASSSDVAKALMLGADGVGMGRSFLIAANVAKAQGVVNYMSSLKEELRMICACLRKERLSQIKNMKSNLFALNDEAARMFGVRRE